MHHARGIDHVERADRQRRPLEIGFYEQDAVQPEAPCGSSAEPERWARQICADHQAIAASQIQAHLASSTSDIDDACIAGNCLVKEAGKHTPFGSCA
jgi:hypothetical protein